MYVLPLPKDKFKGWPKGSYGYQRSSTHVHQGVDLMTPVGTPVLAIGDGVVVRVQNVLSPSKGKGTGPGYHLVIQHPGGVWSWYQHLSKILVKLGDTVKAGQTIAYSGDTMFSDKSAPAHLHFEILTKYPPGREPEGGGIQHRVNPQKFLESQGAVLQSMAATPKGKGSMGLVIVAGAAAWFLLKGRGSHG